MGEWLAAMPAAVARQRALLERLVAVVAAEPATTGLVLGCSLARGAGDGWSGSGPSSAGSRWPTW